MYSACIKPKAMEKKKFLCGSKKKIIQNSLIHILIHHPSGLQRQNIHICASLMLIAHKYNETNTNIHSPQYE